MHDVVTLAIGLAWPVVILVVVILTHPTALVRRGPVYSFQVQMVSGCGRGLTTAKIKTASHSPNLSVGIRHCSAAVLSNCCQTAVSN